MKIIYTILSIIVVIFLALLGWKFYAESHTDSQSVRDLADFNPLIRGENYYVETSTPKSAEDLGKGTLYKYQAKAYNEDGKEKDLEYTATKKLKKERYLKIKYKVGEVKSFEEVSFSDIPKKAKAQLK
ncbi:YxeA family protein [Staphylococcus sp. GSSP0090]|nr:YxeA family protein [Staphylococcus sp. GSSP0090]